MQDNIKVTIDNLKDPYIIPDDKRPNTTTLVETVIKIVRLAERISDDPVEQEVQMRAMLTIALQMAYSPIEERIKIYAQVISMFPKTN